MKRKYLALLTDFGTQDYYVAVLKGVIRRLAPWSEFLDISHHLPAFQPATASFFLEQSLPYLPSDLNGLVVVDPGVGSKRGLLLIRSGSNYWIGPDNGCLSHLLQKEEIETFLVKEDLPFFKPHRSSFEARDRMAPLMGHILSGADPMPWVEVIDKGKLCLVADGPVSGKDTVRGRVVHIDRFGNVIISIKLEHVPGEPREWSLDVDGEGIGEWVSCYEDIQGRSALFFGSHGYLELASRQGSAAESWKMIVGQPVCLRKRKGVSS